MCVVDLYLTEQTNGCSRNFSSFWLAAVFTVGRLVVNLEPFITLDYIFVSPVGHRVPLSFIVSSFRVKKSFINNSLNVSGLGPGLGPGPGPGPGPHHFLIDPGMVKFPRQFHILHSPHGKTLPLLHVYFLVHGWFQN
ncbi:hypothetical protein Csa_011976 [Cucumis sativus]|uniref:Uncharacterized protein n=1 Tax=Cucumis sativus TaxID=3659 RepID=A0A0A0L0V1_CUCSA|nr:hypothetical protein Csa_011976 [Cucumis sativus]